MGSIYDLKPRFQKLLHPLMSYLVNKGFTPNHISIMAMIGSIIIGGIVILGQFNVKYLLALPIWLFIRMALNAIDGMMAREFNMSSSLGAILNEVGDVVSDFVLYFPLIFIDNASLYIIIFFCVGAIMTEFCGILGKSLGVSRHYEGPMGKSDRAFFVGALTLVTAFFPSFKFVWKWFFMTAIILLILTCKNRVANSIIELDNRIKKEE